MENNKNFNSYKSSINGTRIEVVTYKIGNDYFCHVTNDDAGPTISRSKAETAEEAQKVALEKATRRLS